MPTAGRLATVAPSTQAPTPPGAVQPAARAPPECSPAAGRWQSACRPRAEALSTAFAGWRCEWAVWSMEPASERLAAEAPRPAFSASTRWHRPVSARRRRPGFHRSSEPCGGDRVAAAMPALHRQGRRVHPNSIRRGRQTVLRPYSLNAEALAAERDGILDPHRHPHPRHSAYPLPGLHAKYFDARMRRS